MAASKKTNMRNMSCGFTLIEMAMVLMIVGLLLGGMLVPLSAQMDQHNVTETRKTLDDIQQALIGYAIINGRLPCPATSISNGAESPSGGGSCTTFYNGFVPAATLGISPTDSQGYAIDSWGNRIRYAVTSVTATVSGFNGGAAFNVFTFPNGMSAVGISSLSPNLYVCSTATGIGATSCAAGTSLTTNGVPEVLISTGNDGTTGATGIDEAANLDNNKTFVSHVPAPGSAANGTFDDLVVWMSPNILLNRMVAAGKLP